MNDTAPLLSDDRHRSQPSSDDHARHDDNDDDDEHDTFHFNTLAKYCLLLQFSVELSNQILTVPLIALFENAICQTYYRQDELMDSANSQLLDRRSCKIPPIQSELARTRGWKAFFETISSMTTYPSLRYFNN